VNNPLSNRKILSTVNLLLILAILVMVNLVSNSSFRKFDLTRNDAYSLSRVSTETLARLEDPLRVKVFYNPDLPAPYNGVRQYLTDLLREYDAAEGRHFSWETVDVSTPEGQREAQQYGLEQIQIQEVRSDQFQSRAAYMGAVILYGNTVERVDRLVTTDGLEYRLTTAMSSAVTQVDALAGTTDEVVMEVLASPQLEELDIQGLPELEAQMAAIHERVNRDNYDRIRFSFSRPSTAVEIQDAAEAFGVRPLRWERDDGSVQEGLLEIVLHTGEGDRVKRIPFEIYSQLFGGYSLGDPADIEEAVRQGLRGLVAANPRIAYALGHGEKALQDYQEGAGPFAAVAGERYEVLPVRLTEEEIPADIDVLMVNGPTEEYSPEALYRIDQFLMNGGSLFVLLDRYVPVIPSRQQQAMGAQPGWEDNTTGLESLLEGWGATVTTDFVLDEESFTARQRTGSTQLYQAPVLSGDSINKDVAITRGLQDIIVFNTTEITPADGEGPEGADGSPRYTSLLRTSPRSWTVSSPEEVGPWIEGVPPAADPFRRDVAVLLEGSFRSSFGAPLDGSEPGRFLDRSSGEGRVVLLSTSAVTTAQMLDPESRSPNGTFLLNVLDYLNGAPGIAELRSKGLGVPRITVEHPAAVIAARWGNTVLVPALVILIGLVVWSRRRSRSHRIQAQFAPSSETEDSPEGGR
jgi:ABC-2 type transport system permease protein